MSRVRTDEVQVLSQPRHKNRERVAREWGVAMRRSHPIGANNLQKQAPPTL